MKLKKVLMYVIIKKHSHVGGGKMKNGISRDPRFEDFTISDIQLYEQSYFKNGSKVDFFSKPRIYHGLLWVKACTIDVYFPDGSKMRAEHGDVLYLPKGSHYRSVFSDVTDSVPTILFNCTLEFMGKSFALSDSVVRIRLSKTAEFEKLINIARSSPKSPTALKCAFYGIVELWRTSDLPKQPTMDASYAAIVPAISYIESHEHEGVFCTELAAICHMSPSFFRKKFSEALGVSPKEFCLRKRLDRANSLLESGEFTVSEVCELLGFSSPSYFSRIFYKKMGVHAVECLKK